MLSYALNGKFGRNVEINVSNEGKNEFKNLADILMSAKGLVNIKIHTKEENDKRNN